MNAEEQIQVLRKAEYFQDGGPIPHHYLRQLLSEGRVVQITFKKKDGTDRTMTATTNLSVVGPENKPKFVRATSPDVVALFDLDCMEWRSLRADTDIELHGSYYPAPSKV